MIYNVVFLREFLLFDFCCFVPIFLKNCIKYQSDPYFNFILKKDVSILLKNNIKHNFFKLVYIKKN